MPVKNYYSVDGEILGDSEAGDYMRDALGNVTGTTDPNTGAVLNTYRYKPSGELLAKTGSFPDPKFLHVGVHGVRNTALLHAEEDMRARHYSNKEGRFTTVDPLWPGELAYGYASGNPVNNIDPSGLGCPPEVAECCCCPTTLGPLRNVRRLSRYPGDPDPNFMGHSFQVPFGVKYIVIRPPMSARPGDCQLKWMERKNTNPQSRDRGGNVDPREGRWWDGYRAQPTNPVFEEWQNRSRPCPGADSGKFEDWPGIYFPATGRKSRKLEFIITITKSPNCTCGRDSIQIKFTQTLSANNGVRVDWELR